MQLCSVAHASPSGFGQCDEILCSELFEDDGEYSVENACLAFYLHRRDMGNLAGCGDDSPRHLVIDARLNQLNLPIVVAQVWFPYLLSGQSKLLDAVPVIRVPRQSVVHPRLFQPQRRVHFLIERKEVV